MKLEKTAPELIAGKIVENLNADPLAFRHGENRFNNDCVDWCIACWILKEDPLDKMEEHPHVGISKNGASWIDFRNKIQEISKYKDKWCPEGKEIQGLNYLCRGISYYYQV